MLTTSQMLTYFLLGGPVFLLGFVMSLSRKNSDRDRALWAGITIGGVLVVLPACLTAILLIGHPEPPEDLAWMLGHLSAWCPPLGAGIAVITIVWRLRTPAKTGS